MGKRMYSRASKLLEDKYRRLSVVSYVLMVLALEIAGIQKRDPSLQGCVDCRHALRIVRRAVEIRHPHTSKADSRYYWTVTAQYTAIHRHSLSRKIIPSDYLLPFQIARQTEATAVLKVTHA
jgi:hypothetical protein